MARRKEDQMTYNNLFQQNEDGACAQAKAVRAYLAMRDGIEESWSAEWRRYQAEPKISRWENGREQGYVVWMKGVKHNRQINIAFFEHRNSDEICAIEWEQLTMNAPTIDSAVFGEIYKDKYDVSHRVGPGLPMEMADWIFERLTEFWKATA